jgi:formate--tetrahydrofolate ligase
LAARHSGRLGVVTAITPTASGEGKTTTAVSLTDALRRLSRRDVLTVRQPSLGPVIGIKGGGNGGGRAQVVPLDVFNLDLTGDFHAVTAAHNLGAAMLDNNLNHGNALGLEPGSITWPRVVDVNDWVLRDAVVGLGGRSNGPVRPMRTKNALGDGPARPAAARRATRARRRWPSTSLSDPGGRVWV